MSSTNLMPYFVKCLHFESTVWEVVSRLYSYASFNDGDTFWELRR